MSDFNPDEFLAQHVAASTPQPEATEQPTEGFDPDAFLKEANEEKYGTGTQQAIAGVEGLARGVAGPVATFAEKHLLRVPEEDIKGREEANPITSGVSEAVGLGGSMLLGTGEGALLGKVGEAAAGLTKAGEAANTAREAAMAAGIGTKGAEAAAQAAIKAEPLIARVGSSAVQQAAEMAVLQSGNEIHKMILNDPETSAESAVANIGLASALGAGTGAFITGAISPLWKATAAGPLEKGLNTLKDVMDKNGNVLPEDLQTAASTLGVEVPKVVQGGNAGAYGKESAAFLKRMENREYLDAEHKLAKDVSDSVANSLNINTESVANYSKAEAGEALYDTIINPIKEKAKTFGDRYSKEAAENAKIFIPDTPKLSNYDKMVKAGMDTVGTDSPLYKVYDEMAERMLAKDTIGGLDQVIDDIGGRLDAAYRSGNSQEIKAFTEIKSMLNDFKESQIINSGKALEEAGMEGAGKMSAEKLAEKQAMDAEYSAWKKQSRELADFLGIKEPKGAAGWEKALDKSSYEQLLRKASIKNDAEFTTWLAKNNPQALEIIKQNELRELLKPAVLKAKNDNVIDVNKLVKIINDKMAGSPEYIKTLLSPEALAKIQAAETMQKAFAKPLNSGTPKGLMDAISGYVTGAMGMIGGYLGHNPVVGAIGGAMTSLIGKTAPEEMKLALLKFAASDSPVKAEGFKSMVDFMNNVAKGQHTLNKATAAVFKTGTQVAAEHLMPAKADNDKLDKLVTKYQQHPDTLLNTANGQTGHYLPAHQAGLTKTTTGAIQYLESIKPKPFQPSPLDKPIEPSPVEQARYQRALTIANSPMSVLNHVKDGTIQATDIQDLKAVYPALYNNMAQKLSNELIHAHEQDELIPYSTRMGVSIFLGQPIDSTMNPQSIINAQPKPPMQPQGAQPPKGSSLKNLGKSNSTYMTPGQASEAHKANKH